MTLEMVRPAAPVRLPDLPGMVRGIVAVDRSGKRPVYTLQCERCYATEQPVPLVSMTIRLHTRHKGDSPRLCLPCLVDVYADCDCEYCREDRGLSAYGG